MNAEKQIIKKVRIVAIKEETSESRTFVLEPLDGWQPVYKAGQFLTLVFYTQHGEKRRSYSMSSSPETDSYLSITVKKIENGEFSRALVYRAKEGDELYTSGIGGFFSLERSGTASRFCFLAAGSGITPCYSLIKTLLTDRSKHVTLFYSNKNANDTIFYAELVKLKEESENRLQIVFLFSDHKDLHQRRLSRWLLDQLLAKHLGEKTAETFFYLCGPFEYMQMAEITLLMHTDRSHIIKENFSSLPRLTIPRPPDTEEHDVTISINGVTYTYAVKYPHSILKAAQLKGIELPYSCEAGRCGSCIASCTSGKVWLAYNEVLTDKEVASGRVLTCQAFPIEGDVHIEFDAAISGN